MKKTTFFSLFFLVFSLIACQKDEVKIPLADQIEGRYTINSISNTTGTINLPYTSDGNTYTARVLVTKISDEIVDLNLITTVKTDVSTRSSPNVLENVRVIEISNNNLQIVDDGGEKIASFNGGNIEVFTSDGVTSATYTGTKDQ